MSVEYTLLVHTIPGLPTILESLHLLQAIRGGEFQAIGQVTLFNHDLSLSQICVAAFLPTKSFCGNEARRRKISRTASTFLPGFVRETPGD